MRASLFLLAFSFLFAGALAAPAQVVANPADGPRFAAAAIHAENMHRAPGPIHVEFKIEPDRLNVQYGFIGGLLEDAYQLQPYQLKERNPRDPLFRQAYDIRAVTGGPVSADGMRARLATLLATRFHVVSHWKMQTTSMYRLETLPGGVKLKPTTLKGSYSPMSQGQCVLKFMGPTSMPDLAMKVSIFMMHSTPVVDHTGLTGRYEVNDLTFEMPGCVPPASAPGAASPIAALRQIGLTLVRANDPIKVLVIDSAGPVTGN